MADSENMDIEQLTQTLKTSRFARCVYEAGNDVVDHQSVIVEYEGGTTATMTMSACKCILDICAMLKPE